MNIELIKKHKPEFDWWLEDPYNRTCMGKVDGGSWIEYQDPFNLSVTGSVTILKNDEYAKFRMAEADGKIVQINASPAFAPRWRDMKSSAKYGVLEPKYYRIKPKAWKWQDDASKEKPVLCKVWDDGGLFTESNTTTQFITGHDQSDTLPYIDNHSNLWQHAIPILIKDLHPFQCVGYLPLDEIKHEMEKHGFGFEDTTDLITADKRIEKGSVVFHAGLTEVTELEITHAYNAELDNLGSFVGKKPGYEGPLPPTSYPRTNVEGRDLFFSKKDALIRLKAKIKAGCEYISSHLYSLKTASASASMKLMDIDEESNAT